MLFTSHGTIAFIYDNLLDCWQHILSVGWLVEFHHETKLNLVSFFSDLVEKRRKYLWAFVVDSLPQNYLASASPSPSSASGSWQVSPPFLFLFFFNVFRKILMQNYEKEHNSPSPLCASGSWQVFKFIFEDVESLPPPSASGLWQVSPPFLWSSCQRSE